jgi:hypothetical protein
VWEVLQGKRICPQLPLIDVKDPLALDSTSTTQREILKVHKKGTVAILKALSVEKATLLKLMVEEGKILLKSLDRWESRSVIQAVPRRPGTGQEEEFSEEGLRP